MIFVLKFELKDTKSKNQLKNYLDKIQEKNHKFRFMLNIENGEIIILFIRDSKSASEFLSLTMIKYLNELLKQLIIQFEINIIKFYIKDLKYQEKITRKSNSYQVESPNHYNHIVMYMEPIDSENESFIHNWNIKNLQDLNERVKDLKKAFGWKKKEISRIIDIYLGNILMNDTSKQQMIDRVKLYLVEAVRAWLNEGIIAKEPAMGFKIVISDILIHSNSRHNQYGQIAAMIFSAMSSTMQSAEPHLYEPLHSINFKIAYEDTNFLYKTRNEIIAHKKEDIYDNIHVECPTECLMNIIEKAEEIIDYEFIGYKIIPEEFEEKIILELRKSKGLYDLL